MKTHAFISTDPVNGCYYPQRTQNLIIKSYCREAGLDFSLPLTELSGLKDSSLEDLLNSAEGDVVFFSSLQVSTLTGKGRHQLKQYLDEKRGNYHFALESINISDSMELEKLFHNLFLKDQQPEVSFYQYNKKPTSFITSNHLKTSRDYQGRAGDDKADFAQTAKKFGQDFWDGTRDTGYGGYVDDGRWKAVAEKFILHYNLQNGCSILDIGCGKGFLLKEFKELLPDSTVFGVDVSDYALSHASELVADNLIKANAVDLPFADNSFDLVLSNMTLHNLILPELHKAIREINRVAYRNSWIGVESYTNEQQKWNLMRWQLTCECFFTPEEWKFVFSQCHYHGDYELIYFD